MMPCFIFFSVGLFLCNGMICLSSVDPAYTGFYICLKYPSSYKSFFSDVARAEGGGVNEEKYEFLDEVGRNVDIQFFLFFRDP